MSWDGKIYDKYRIEHADGTPLKGKKYFVLRLDSDNHVEAARVAAAMRAYKGEPRNCDVGTSEEQTERFKQLCRKYRRGPGPRANCKGCPISHESQNVGCTFAWSQMPYEEGDNYGSK